MNIASTIETCRLVADNHIIDIQALLCGLPVELTTIQRVPRGSAIRVIHTVSYYSGRLAVSEVQHERTDAVDGVYSRNAVGQLEVGAEGTDAGAIAVAGLGVIKRVLGAEEEDAPVLAVPDNRLICALECHLAVRAGHAAVGIVDGHAVEGHFLDV